MEKTTDPRTFIDVLCSRIHAVAMNAAHLDLDLVHVIETSTGSRATVSMTWDRLVRDLRALSNYASDAAAIRHNYPLQFRDAEAGGDWMNVELGQVQAGIEHRIKCEDLDPETRKELDYLNPDWAEGGPVHNWKNYVSEELQALWPTMEPRVRIAIAKNAEENADDEEWGDPDW